MAYKNGQKAARLREIAARLRELDADDKLITGPDRASPDGRQQIAEIAVERRQLREERDELLADPEPEPGPIREEIARMWQVVAAFDQRLREWRHDDEARRAEDKTERLQRQALQDRWFSALALVAVIEALGIILALVK